MHKIYSGFVRHRRFKPCAHELRYPIYYFYLNLQQLSNILCDGDHILANKWWLPRWLRHDYHRPVHTDLLTLIKQQVQKELRFTPEGPIYQLTQLRHFHYCFNPITLYYCFDSSNNLQAVVADVGNIPWLERHTYVLDLRQSSKVQHDKQFHVSPLLPMDMQYHWQITRPGKQLTIHINNIKNGEKWFDATLNLSEQPLTLAALKPLLWRYPLQTYRIVARIYWQALKLRLKGATYYIHPNKES